MSLESNKTLAGIGAILVAIPFLNLIGIILVLIAMNGLADYYHEDGIFRNALYGFIFGIIGVVAFIIVIMMLVTGVAFVSPVAALFIGIGFIVSLIVMYIFSLIGAIFYRNSFNILSQKTGEGMFETAGLILLIGAIIPIIGEVLKFIAWILAAVGFFSIKTPTTQVSAVAPPPPPQPPSAPPVAVPGEKKYCQYCGTENKIEALFCQKCGKQMIGEKET